MTIKCPACGKENSRKQDFCVNCGGVIPKLERLNWGWSNSNTYVSNPEARVNDFLFAVGQNEKHYVAVKYDSKSSKFTVFVDSSDVPHPIQNIGPKTVSLDVGQEERHKVTLTITGSWAPRLEALVDGALAYKS